MALIGWLDGIGIGIGARLSSTRDGVCPWGVILGTEDMRGSNIGTVYMCMVLRGRTNIHKKCV